MLLTAVLAAYLYLRPLLLTATGYAAHNACAVELVAGRDNPETDLPSNPLVPYLRVTTNEAEGWSEASILGLLAKQRAWFTDGHGCTLAKDRPQLPKAAEVSRPNGLTDAAVEAGAPEAVASAVHAQFDLTLSRPNGLTDLGTRGVVVLHQGKLIAEEYRDGFDATTPQLGWSMAKSVTNLLVGTQVADGAVDPAHAPADPAWTDARARISLDHLMRMTSGLTWDETYDLGTPITAMLYLEADMGGFAASQPLAHTVGTYQQYSSGSTNIVCDALEREVGGGGNLPRTALFEPLGLSSAVWEPDTSGVPVCSSYLWATPRDWAAIGQFVLDDGVVDGERLLPEGWIASSTTATQVDGEEGGNYAAGWWTNKRADGSLVAPDLPDDAFWAQGHDGQRLYVVPSEDLVVARLGFSPGIPGSELETDAMVAGIIKALKQA